MRGTFGLGGFLKKALRKNNNNPKKNVNKKIFRNDPIIRKLEKDKTNLLEKETNICDDINKLNKENLFLKDEIKKYEFAKKKVPSNSTKITLQEFNSELNKLLIKRNESNYDKSSLNKKINSVRKEINKIKEKLNAEKKEISELSERILESNDEININNSKITALNEEIQSLKIEINSVDEKISEEIQNKDFENSRIRKRNTIFAILIPICFMGIYFYGIGRERYRVSSNVVVRKSGSSADAGGGFVSLLGLGNQGSLEDARFLKIYLESPQLMDDLFNFLDFRSKYLLKSPDIFAGLKNNSSKEETYDFFRKQVVIVLDEISGSLNIVTIALDPKTAFEFNKFLIEKSEEFVNKLNQNIYLRQIDFVEKQVYKNRKRLLSDLDTLNDFQRNNLSLNLNQELISSSSIISSLENKLIELKLKLSVLKRKFIDPNAPEISDLETQIEELKKQIQEERNLLVSPLGKNIGEKASELSRLEANFEFSNNLLKSSLAASEKTKLDSKQQQRFMATLSQPFLPEDEWYYWRHKGFLTSLATILVSYFLIKFFMGIADSHNN